ncbi:cytochrome P450 302a1, mitochondrial-like isoform X1 [Dermacentor variabilis]|uniref:cytochrome P450 302a1, mitochondrial-like isoform X1 n=2 Tax=Dermacentor variabilis TaxID=34621 RepID=UPI003F5B0513
MGLHSWTTNAVQLQSRILRKMRCLRRSLLCAVHRTGFRENSSLAAAAAEKQRPVEHDVCPVHGDKLQQLQGIRSRPAGAISDTARPFHEIPGPKPLPLIGNIWRYLPLIGDMDLTRMHRNAQKLLDRYGPLVREVVVGDRVVVHVFDPRDMEHVFRHEGRYPARLSHRALLKYRRERPHMYSSGGLFPTNGEEWFRLRHMFQKPLMQRDAMSAYIDVLQDVTLDVANLVRQTRDSRTLEVEDFLKELYQWALECTGVLALNTRLGCLQRGLSSESEQQRLVEAASETHRIIMVTENGLPFWKMWNTPAYRKLVESQDFMASVVSKYLERTKVADQNVETGRELTVLEKLLSTPGADLKDVFAMILDMFLAGIDTTAYSTTFILYYLARNRRCQDKLALELGTLLPTKDSKLSMEQLQEAVYLRACIKESLRLSPIAIGVGRVLPEDIVLSGYTVPAGTVLIMHNQVACRQESNYPEPDAYWPERWLKERSEGGRAHPFTLLPFGYGPRMCIGKRFAETVMCLLVARIVRNFVLEYKHEDLDCFTRLINVPDKPLRMTFIDRNS